MAKNVQNQKKIVHRMWGPWICGGCSLKQSEHC